jgi:ATP-dependent DNA helicase DinG
LNAGTLVLFSSKKQMLDVYEELPSEMQDKILLQGDASKQEMLVQHKQKIDQGEGSVLFGLASFAEGVDLPGNYCTHVIIAKLPFAVPDDPIEAALSEWIESRGGNAFMELTVPDASLKLIQACGRLLRTETDKGKISLLDRRIISKRYGKAILNSLPPFRQVIN